MSSKARCGGREGRALDAILVVYVTATHIGR
jgi:hypothetical protein